jgi:hypothetical protein
MVANITHNTDFSSNIYFGSITGYAENSNISNVICRSTETKNLQLTGNDGKSLTYGGMVGVLSNSSITFGVTSFKFNLNIGENFDGSVKFGGIVGNVNQGGSKIVNVASENTFAITNNSTVVPYVGQVAGVVSNPAPSSGNISYIHYKSSSSVDRFGNIGSYNFSQESVYDYVTVAQYNLTSIDYFDNQNWDDFYGDWDFDSVWYFGASTIYLQSFYGNYNVTISNNLNTDVLSMTNKLENGYRYGDTVDLQFAFKDITEQEKVVGNMMSYYNLSSIYLNSNEVAKIVTVTTTDGFYYRISGSNAYEISKDEKNENAFTLTISSVNQSTAGEYYITTETKTFNIKISSRLYDKNEELKSGSVPGYVYYAQAPNSTTESLTLSKIGYGQTNRVGTVVKSNTANKFDGWYLVGQDGKDVELSTNYILEITFGKGNFTADCEIYAKYSDNACIVTFKMDEGVDRVELYSGGRVITESGKTEGISKTESSLKLEIYVKKNYDFDVDKFILELDTYKTQDPNKTFCTLRDSYDTGEYHYYLFILDMTSLQGDFANAFTITSQTTVAKTESPSWLWYVVGGVGGTIVLALVILAIVLIAKRRGGGGGRMSGGSFSKKSYKNMYY